MVDMVVRLCVILLRGRAMAHTVVGLAVILSNHSVSCHSQKLSAETSKDRYLLGFELK